MAGLFLPGKLYSGISRELCHEKTLSSQDVSYGTFEYKSEKPYCKNRVSERQHLRKVLKRPEVKVSSDIYVKYESLG